jgi:hypothetical protein
VLLPVIILYMLSLVLAAWPAEIRPDGLDRISVALRDILEVAGIRAGMSVFEGTNEKKTELVISRCIIVDGIDSDGSTTRIYPVEECPPVGFRWRPVIYEHMLLHWSWNITPRVESPDLWAMGDHFCNSSPKLDLRFVEIRQISRFLNYKTGSETRYSNLLGYMPCRH